MATLGCGLVICWLIALRVVDRRRAFFVVVMLALYPIFNFKGFKYNPDLLQLVTLPLLVLAYLNAFEKRSVRSGLWLGLAGALALMTKYWVLTMIGAVGLAALLHPDRLQFLRSPAPWVAIATLVAVMLPHLVVAARSGLRAADLCRRCLCAFPIRAENMQLVSGLCRPQCRAAGAAGRAGVGWRWPGPTLVEIAAAVGTGSRAPGRAARNAGVNLSQALNVWIIQAIVAIGPLLGGAGLQRSI